MNIIILPVHNEEKTIYATVTELQEFCDGFFMKGQYELVVINDGSTDKTLKVCKEIQGVRVINNMFDRGKGSALKTAVVICDMLYAIHESDKIIFIDGDGQIDPNEINVMCGLMEIYQAHAVVGNKRHRYSMTEYTPTRRIISQTYNNLIRFLFDIKLEDTQCGIKIFNYGALKSVIEKVTTKQYAFDLELIIAMRANKYRIVDSPVTIKPQMNRGAISIESIISTFMDTIKVFIKMKKRFYVT